MPVCHRAPEPSIATFQSVYGPAWLLRTTEQLLTAVYQYEVQAGLTIQPNVQFIRYPGGGATDPLGPRPASTSRTPRCLASVRL
ncbi:carbohydrate porin [Bradyrhizobium liaoningense]|uniref:carbohydrate porin n=1 Tax=Bradyrhizobium liaoningense TaxID=43992 RepID=UPI002011C211|nr:carbohydrate porin [Bradyrhizobium liaoningense]